MIEGISAITLFTGDMARSVDFYQRLGFDITYGGPDAPFTTFAAGRCFLNLMATDAQTGWPTWGRTIFYVDDVDAFYAAAVANGITPQFTPRDASWGERYFHVTDPSGHEMSFAHPLPRRD